MENMSDQAQHLRELISEYWEIAYREGKSGRTVDDEAGSAGKKWAEICAALAEIEAAIEATLRPTGASKAPVRCPGCGKAFGAPGDVHTCSPQVAHDNPGSA